MPIFFQQPGGLICYVRMYGSTKCFSLFLIKRKSIKTSLKTLILQCDNFKTPIVHLTERVFNNHFVMLIGVLSCLIIISYSIRNRPILLKSIFLANLKKTHFKIVSNNIQDQIIELLFWNSLLLQSLFFFSYLTEKRMLFIKPLFLFIFLVVLKRVIIFLSEKIFQINHLLSHYFPSFIIMVIHLGWLTILPLILKIPYYSWLSSSQIKLINSALFTVASFYLFYRFCNLLWASGKENISFLHIIFYLCTLEILPFVLISSFLFF